MGLSGSRPVVVLGPTAGGKSELAVQLAEHLGGEVLGADSMQVYRHLDAGTAKPPRKLRDRVPHHLIDIVEPSERFTVYDWLGRAHAIIGQLQHKGVTPVVVGGTNLYLKALLEGLFEGPGRDEAFRESLKKVPGTVLHDRLRQIDPPAADRIAPADRQRLTRALEVFHLTGRPISAMQTQWEEGGSGKSEGGTDKASDAPVATSDLRLPTSALLLGLRWPTDAINARINLRVKAMFYPEKVAPDLAAEVCIGGESLPDEVRRLVAAGLLDPAAGQAREALGYKQVLAALMPQRCPDPADPRNLGNPGDLGNLRDLGNPRDLGTPKIRTLDDAYERTKILTRRFAKQQRTWLKRFPAVHWLDPALPLLPQAVAALNRSQI